jgi:hypothetical protein
VFLELGHGRIPPIKTKKICWTGTTNSGYCAAVAFNFLEKSVESVFYRLQEYVQNVGTCADI